MIPERLAQARSFGCETIDLHERVPLGERIAQIVGVPEVDSAVDCVGFEAKGQGAQSGTEQPATVLNSLMGLTRAGGAIGIPGLYVTDDPGAQEDAAKQGVLGLRIGLGWAKSHTFGTGQCPVLRYNRQLMMAILHNKVAIAEGGECYRAGARGCAARVSRLRQGRREEIRSRSAWDRAIAPIL